MFQESELFNLAFALLSIGFLSAFRLFRLQIPPCMAAGFGALVAAYLFTVIEGLALDELFNFMEHLSYAVAGVCFCVGSLKLARGQGDSPVEDT